MKTNPNTIIFNSKFILPVKYPIKYFVFGCTALFIACGSGNKNANRKNNTGAINSAEAQQENPQLQESFNQEDLAKNEYLNEELRPVRANFKKLNSVTNWSKTENKELTESTEGGMATFYYSGGQLNKIIASHYGETFRRLDEYYLLDGRLSFVFEKSLRYNRPFYYDSVAMRENGDDQVFDIKKSRVEENRSYFLDGKLVHQLNNQDCGSPFTEGYLRGEEVRLLAEFDKLMDLPAME